MKKLSLTLLACAAIIAARAETATIEGVVYSLDPQSLTATITGFDKTAAAITLKSPVYQGSTPYALADGGKVTVKLGADAAATHLFIQKGISELPEYFAKDNKTLTYLGMPTDKLAAIPSEAFCGCSNLAVADLSQSTVEEVGDWAFYQCAISEVFVPASVSTIGEHAWASNPISSVTIAAAESENVTPMQVATDAFGSNHPLSQVVCYRKIVPDIKPNTFMTDQYKADLFVPAQSESAYHAAIGWRNFNMVLTGIDDAVAPAAVRYEVYNLQGIHVLSAREASALRTLPAGLYIINGRKHLIR